MANDKTLVIKINGNIKGYQDALKKASNETESLQNQLKSIAKTSTVAFAGFGAAIAFATKEAAKFETIETQFEVLTGSVTQAKNTIKDLSDFSAKTPFKFEQIAQAGKQLLGFQIPADQLRSTLGRIGDVAAATGANFGELSTVFGQVKAAGKLTGERLLQFQERAVPIGPALAKTMGVAETAIRDLVSKGQVSFKVFEKAFASLSEEGGLAFQGMEKNSQTLEGQLSTLSDNFDLVTASVGKEFLPVAKQITGALISFFQVIRENPALSKLISKVLIFGTVTTAIIAGVSLLAIGFLKLRAALVASTLATRGLSFAVKGLMGATGLGLIITFLPEILDLFGAVFTGVSNIVKNSGDAIIKVASNIGKVLVGLLTLNFSKITEGIVGFKEAFSKVADATVNEFKKSNSKIADSEKETTDTIEEEGKKRINSSQKVTEAIDVDLEKRKRKLQNERELIVATNNKLAKEEIDFLKRRHALREEALMIDQIQDATEKNLAVGNLKLKNDQLLAEEAAFRKKRQSGELSSAEEKAKKEAEALEKRKEKLRNEAEFLKAGFQETERAESEFFQRRQDLKNETIEANKIKDQEERDLALENLRLKNEQLLAEESEFFAKKEELKAEQREKEAELQAELNALSAEQREALKEEDIESLRNSLETKEEIRANAVKAEIKASRKEKAILAADEQKHGAIVAKLKAFERSENLNNAKTAANELSALQNSENSKLRDIGKAAALAQIAIDTQRGALAAYVALAGIPIVGPALGIAAAAALTAFGAERAQKVQAAQAGGIVSGTGTGDTVPFLLEPGELITPRKNFDEVINAVADQRSKERGAEESERAIETQQNINIGFDGDEASDVLTVRQNEDRALGISQEFTR